MQEPLDSTSHRYRLLATVLYLGALIVATSDWILDRPGDADLITSFAFAEFVVFVVVTIILFRLDLYTVNRYQLKLPKRTNTIHLGVRILLIVLAFASIVGLSQIIFLHLALTLYAYLTMGRTTGVSIAMISLMALCVRLAFGPKGDFISVDDLERIFFYAAVTIFALVLGDIIRREAASHAQTQTLIHNLADTNQQLEASMEQVAELAATEERNRLARDIHDSLGHYLAAINVQLEMVIKLYDRQPAMAKDAAIQAKAATQAALSDVRESVRSLRDGGERFVLQSALETLIAQVEGGTLQVDWQINGDELRCPQKILMTLYRATQEGLTNVVKHASATEVRLAIDIAAEQVYFVMQDNGVGLNDVVSSGRSEGFGLQGIRERVALVQGTMSIEGKSGEGTTLSLMIPYEVS